MAQGDNEFYPREVSWIKSRIRKDEQPEEKPVISVKEAKTFANSFGKIEYRTLILMLFDSGFRIQEMLSVKKKDLTWERFQEDENCFWIMCNESKTLTRKVPIPLFTEDIQAFYNSSYYTSLQEDELIFKISYSNILNYFKNHSQKLFKKSISPHSLRHSSATYYSKEYDGNMNLIASRYGWSFSSKELKTYIRRSGAYEKQGVKKIYENEVVTLRKKVKELEVKMDKMETRFFKTLTKLETKDAVEQLTPETAKRLKSKLVN